MQEQESHIFEPGSNPPKVFEDEIHQGVPDVAKLAPLARLWARMRTPKHNNPPTIVLPRTQYLSPERHPNRQDPHFLIDALHKRGRSRSISAIKAGKEAGTHIAPSPLPLAPQQPQQLPIQECDGSEYSVRPDIIHSNTAKKNEKPKAPSREPVEPGKNSRISMADDSSVAAAKATNMILRENTGSHAEHSCTIAHETPGFDEWGPSKVPVETKAQLPKPSQLTPSIPVQVPMSKLERVKRLKLVSSNIVNAREVPTTDRDKEKLRTFSSFVSSANQPTLFGRQLPQCHRYLVQIDESHFGGKPVQTYICIEGLTEVADIRDFHAVMSQRIYRKYYEPWKLCFKKCEVTPQASLWEQTYHICTDSDEDTLCGALINTEMNGEGWISTIGGLVEVDGALFALTTSHLPYKPEPEGSGTSLTSPIETLVENDFADDVEPALVIVFEDRDHSPPNTEMDQTKANRIPVIFWPNIDATTVAEEGDDWRLIPVTNEYKLPNYVRSTQLEMLDDIAVGASQLPKKYITDCSNSPSSAPVIVKAGVTGDQVGVVSLNSSFLDGKEGSQEVWVVHLSNFGMKYSSPHLGKNGLFFNRSSEW
jgi:hypothetical protein